VQLRGLPGVYGDGGLGRFRQEESWVSPSHRKTWVCMVIPGVYGDDGHSGVEDRLHVKPRALQPAAPPPHPPHPPTHPPFHPFFWIPANNNHLWPHPHTPTPSTPSITKGLQYSPRANPCPTMHAQARPYLDERRNSNRGCMGRHNQVPQETSTRCSSPFFSGRHCRSSALPFCPKREIFAIAQAVSSWQGSCWRHPLPPGAVSAAHINSQLAPCWSHEPFLRHHAGAMSPSCPSSNPLPRRELLTRPLQSTQHCN
jgi:hypothetical protein